jgi:hypothetical protein
MFRKLILGSVASVALLTPLAMPTNAQAFEHRHYVHRCTFAVYYRDACRPVWVCGGTFPSHRAAVRFAEGYRRHGFAVQIR